MKRPFTMFSVPLLLGMAAGPFALNAHKPPAPRAGRRRLRKDEPLRCPKPHRRPDIEIESVGDPRAID